MKDKKCLELMSSPCDKDYKNRHYWERRGVFIDAVKEPVVLWQCTQCECCLVEKLTFLSFVEEDVNNG